MADLINPGRLNKRVVLYANRMVENELLELEQEQYVLGKAWAMITQKKSRVDHLTAVEIERAINRIYVTIRYRKDITKDMIVEVNSDKYEIKTITDVNYEKKFLELMCERVTE